MKKLYLLVRAPKGQLQDFSDTVNGLLEEGYEVNGTPFLMDDELVQNVILKAPTAKAEKESAVKK